MRLSGATAELAEAFAAVERLARANFKDAGIFLEKYVEQARHIEVQIFGDGRGNVVALGERDCSAQRRNQKVIEETPAPRPAGRRVRAALLDAAVRLAQAVGYRSAGTVEFIYDAASGEFYFLEVNTRLQVEHGVTEEVTGIDLVEWMVRQAAGELRSRAASSRTPRGASIQVRLYAEDPAQELSAEQRRAHRSASFPPKRACETWVERGTEVTPLLRPAARQDHRSRRRPRRGAVREAARGAGRDARRRHRDQPRLPAAGRRGPRVRARAARPPATSAASAIVRAPSRCSTPGMQTTVQDWPGRARLLGRRRAAVGSDGRARVPPRQPTASAIPTARPALEITAVGPDAALQLRRRHRALPAPTCRRELDGEPVALWRPHRGHARAACCGSAPVAGRRAAHLPRGARRLRRARLSRQPATFTLGRFGGHAGRALRAGDVLHAAGRRAAAEHGRCAGSVAHPALRRRAGRSACCTARTARPTSSRPRTSRRSSPPTGRCTTTPAAPACA